MPTRAPVRGRTEQESDLTNGPLTKSAGVGAAYVQNTFHFLLDLSDPQCQLASMFLPNMFARSCPSGKLRSWLLCLLLLLTLCPLVFAGGESAARQAPAEELRPQCNLEGIKSIRLRNDGAGHYVLSTSGELSRYGSAAGPEWSLGFRRLPDLPALSVNAFTERTDGEIWSVGVALNGRYDMGL